MILQILTTFKNRVVPSVWGAAISSCSPLFLPLQVSGTTILDTVAIYRLLRNRTLLRMRRLTWCDVNGTAASWDM